MKRKTQLRVRFCKKDVSKEINKIKNSYFALSFYIWKEKVSTKYSKVVPKIILCSRAMILAGYSVQLIIANIPKQGEVSVRQTSSSLPVRIRLFWYWKKNLLSGDQIWHQGTFTLRGALLVTNVRSIGTVNMHFGSGQLKLDLLVLLLFTLCSNNETHGSILD